MSECAGEGDLWANSRGARRVCAAVFGVVRHRPTLLLVGVAGAALLSALLSSSWSAHGQGLDIASVDAGSLWIDRDAALPETATITHSPLHPDHPSDDLNSQPTSGPIRAVFSSIVDTPASGGPAPTQTLEPKVLVTPTFLRIAEGGSGTYWIYLRSAPSANVTVVISAGAGLTAYPAEVKFTPTTWRSAQIITITALDDTDANDGTATISYAIKTGSASEYLSVDLRSVRVVIEDDDDAGISASATRMRIAEGDSGTIDVKLEPPPTTDVTVTAMRIGNTNVMVDSSSVTFTRTDWSMPKPFTVFSTDNEERGRWDEDGPISVRFASSSSDTNYNGLVGPRVRVEIADDEGTGACLNVEPRRLYVPEDGTATFTVALCTKPTARGSDMPEVEMRIDAGGDVTTDSARLTFNESNWASGHTVTISAGNDDDGANDTLTITISGASGTDGIYVGSRAGVVTTVIDDDSGGIISPTAITVPEDGMGYYKAAIISEPSGNVTISISSGPEVTTNVSRLTFGYLNWATPRYVIVSAAADSVAEDVGVNLTHSISGSSSEYDAITLPDVMVTVADGGAGPVSFAQADEPDGAQLSWNPPPKPITSGLRTTLYQYEIERSVDSGGYGLLTCVDADSPSYLGESVEAGKEYRYRERTVYYATTRCVTPRDIELTSGTLVARSADDVWSDGETIWVAHATDAKLYAYDVATGAAQADDDITAASTYADIGGGLWGDATRIRTATAEYYATPTSQKTVAFVPYAKSNGAFLSNQLIVTSGDMRPSGHGDVSGCRRMSAAGALFSDGSTFWAAETGRDTMFAYRVSDGLRLYESDIVVPDSVCEDDQIEGVWHDTSDARLYLSTQCSVRKLFALDLSDGTASASHNPFFDSTLRSSHGEVKDLWSDGDIVWVSSNTGVASTRDSVLAYPLHNNRQYLGWSTPPTAESVAVAESSITQTEAAATVTVSGADGIRVHLRYADTTDPENWTTTDLAA